MSDNALPAGPLPARASDYAHSRHAANVGDVFKHIALTAALGTEPGFELYVESHAGDGLFTLGSVGEWTAGIQRLWPLAPPPGATDRFLGAVRAHSAPAAPRPERSPGSPLLAQALLPAQARMVLHELDPQAAAVLRRSLAQTRAAGPLAAGEVIEADGFAGLVQALAAAPRARALALVDPPYSSKQEWSQAASCLVAARKANPGASLLLWYPVKALTRPRALLAELAGADLHGTLVELISTPLRLKREKLNGSGVIFVNPPAGAVEELCAQLPLIGPPLATHGEWSATQIGF